MHILFLTDNFPPESNAPANRTYEHAVEWVSAGHDVTVITGAPNFPQGKLYPGYSNKWYQVEAMDGIRVVRVKTFISANEGFISRILDYLSFMISGTVATLCQRKIDLIVATSPQFFCAIAGWLSSVFRWKPFVLEIRDMWPSSIVAVGAMKDGIFIRLMEKVEHFLYRRAALIIVVSKAFKNEMVERGIAADKIHVVLNGVDEKLFFPYEKNQALLTEYGLKDQFVIGYVGTHGLAHDLVNVLQAVERLQAHSQIQFIFVGAGAERARIEKIVGERKLGNVTMIPQQPRSVIPKIIAICDLCIVPLRNDPVFAAVIPSKIFECQAVGVPVVMSLPEGEATRLVEQDKCGVVVPPESPELLAAALLHLAEHPEEVAELSRNATVAASKYSRKILAKTMLDYLMLARA